MKKLNQNVPYNGIFPRFFIEELAKPEGIQDALNSKRF
jgi:hypothetical protein